VEKMIGKIEEIRGVIMSRRYQTQCPEERRLTSILFGDILGFSGLADKLDFEIVSDFVKEIWLRLDPVILESDGYIDKHIGDGFMVVWGAPKAHEDDAERAVSTGIAILRAFKEYKKESGCPEIKDLQLRIGIDTGQVLAGYIGTTKEYTMMGRVVNLAKRLEEAAKPGTLLISESTYQFVRGAYKAIRLYDLKLRGFQDPVSAYHVIKPMKLPSKLRYRSLGGLDTHLVGKKLEYEKIISLFQRAHFRKDPTLVLVIGEAGLGKSRLMMEALTHIEGNYPQVRIMSSRALEQTKQISYNIWKEFWSNLFDVRIDEKANIASKKTLAGTLTLCGTLPRDEITRDLISFIGREAGINKDVSRYLNPISNNSEIHDQRIFELHRELFSRANLQGPIILELNDLHWADISSINLLLKLIDSSAMDVPHFILASARPSIRQDYPSLLDQAEIINLNPLPVDINLVREAYPALNSAPSSLLEDLANRAEGNPYYLEELVKNLFCTEKRHIEDLNEIPNPPPSLQMLLQARLGALSPEARATALFASVIGRVFWKGAILALFRGSTGVTSIFDVSRINIVNKVKQSLEELTRKEISFPRVGSTFSGEKEYIFKQSMLREVAYNLLPKKHAAQCHQIIADWLSQKIGKEHIVTIANHYQQAGNLKQAKKYLLKAAEYAASVGNINIMTAYQDQANSFMLANI
jgi:class 3 adenylate cyclase